MIICEYVMFCCLVRHKVEGMGTYTWLSRAIWSHDQVGHKEGSGLWSDSVWLGGQNGNISGSDGEG